MRVVFVAAEAAPFVKVGGLADVVGALPAALRRLGTEVALVLPKYKAIDGDKCGLHRLEHSFSIQMRSECREATLYMASMPGSDIPVCLIGNDYYFGRDGVYDDPQTRVGYEDNGERFAFFQRAALVALKQLGWQPDIIHCHDHQTGLIPAYLKITHSADPSLQRTATLFTIHNLAYQGLFPPEILPLAGFDPSLFYPMSPFEFWGRVNFMKVGILYADIITTVSPTYSREIQSTEEYGYGLEGVLRDRRHDLFGILNGIDYSIWNPETDPLIAANYSADNLEPKRLNKLALLERAGLGDDRAPLIGMISRLVDQKGLDLISEAADAILQLNVRMVVLGTGQKKYHDMLERMMSEHPSEVRAFFGFDEALAHLIEAGSDLYLMPSRFEPCGLNQMYSLRYGTIPVVRATGGLADTIRDFDETSGEGNGFVFHEYSARALLAALGRAVALYRDKPEVWRGLMARAMREDFSWDRSARQYLELYQRALEKRRSGR